LVTYSSEASIPAGSTYCEMSIAQVFRATLDDEKSYGILLNPGGDPKTSMTILDGDVITAERELGPKPDRPFFIRKK
jgi:hypothetical protein